MPNSCHALTRLDLILGRTDGENFGRAPFNGRSMEGWLARTLKVTCLCQHSDQILYKVKSTAPLNDPRDGSQVSKAAGDRIQLHLPPGHVSAVDHDVVAQAAQRNGL